MNGSELARRLLEDDNDDIDVKHSLLHGDEELRAALEAHFKPLLKKSLKAKDWVNVSFQHVEGPEWCIGAHVYDSRAWFDAQAIDSQVVTEPERSILEMGRLRGAFLNQLRGAFRRANVNRAAETVRISSMQWMGDQYTGHMDFMEDGPGNWEIEFVFELDEDNPWIRSGSP